MTQNEGRYSIHLLSYVRYWLEVSAESTSFGTCTCEGTTFGNDAGDGFAGAVICGNNTGNTIPFQQQRFVSVAQRLRWIIQTLLLLLEWVEFENCNKIRVRNSLSTSDGRGQAVSTSTNRKWRSRWMDSMDGLDCQRKEDKENRHGIGIVINDYYRTLWQKSRATEQGETSYPLATRICSLLR